jgi:deoxyribose-phosphate aldolase
MLDLKCPKKVAGLIDQTLLQPTATRAQVIEFCKESVGLGFAAVCLAPCWVTLASQLLEKGEVRVCTVAGFPLGFQPVDLKVMEVQTALAAGAEEIDYVVNLGAVKGGERDLIGAEMREIRRSAEQAVVKVILETGYLTREEMKWLCRLAVEAGLDFVKTSTGLGPTGANADEIRFLAQCGGDGIKIKAAGGIRLLDDLAEMILAGAHRIGTSAGREIVNQAAAGQISRT